MAYLKETFAKGKSIAVSTKEIVVKKKLTIVNWLQSKSQMASMVTIPFAGLVMGAAAMALMGVALGYIAGQMNKNAFPFAKGGVVTGTTFAMIGEGRYDEAVVPLGSSPQFASMKSDIANAVIESIGAMGGFGGGATKSGSTEIVLNVDGEKLARAIIPRIDSEHRRKGYALVLREV
jgi:hypothetical protein